MNRRSFLGSILALGAAPAIVRAESLMPIMAWNYGPVPVGELVLGRFFLIEGIKYWDHLGTYHPQGIGVSGIATLEGNPIVITASGFIHKSEEGLFVASVKHIVKWKRP